MLNMWIVISFTFTASFTQRIERQCAWDLYFCDNPYNVAETLHFRCRHDDDCPRNFMCCSHRCFRHKICQPYGIDYDIAEPSPTTFEIKNGDCDLSVTCDIPLPKAFSKAFECFQDYDCPEHYKCCFVSCYNHKVCQRAKNENIPNTSSSLSQTIVINYPTKSATSETTEDSVKEPSTVLTNADTTLKATGTNLTGDIVEGTTTETTSKPIKTGESTISTVHLERTTPSSINSSTESTTVAITSVPVSWTLPTIRESSNLISGSTEPTIITTLKTLTSKQLSGLMEPTTTTASSTISKSIGTTIDSAVRVTSATVKSVEVTSVTQEQESKISDAVGYTRTSGSVAETSSETTALATANEILVTDTTNIKNVTGLSSPTTILGTTPTILGTAPTEPSRNSAEIVTVLTTSENATTRISEISTEIMLLTSQEIAETNHSATELLIGSTVAESTLKTSEGLTQLVTMNTTYDVITSNKQSVSVAMTVEETTAITLVPTEYLISSTALLTTKVNSSTHNLTENNLAAIDITTEIDDSEGSGDLEIKDDDEDAGKIEEDNTFTFLGVYNTTITTSRILSESPKITAKVDGSNETKDTYIYDKEREPYNISTLTTLGIHKTDSQYLTQSKVTSTQTDYPIVIEIGSKITDIEMSGDGDVDEDRYDATISVVSENTNVTDNDFEFHEDNDTTQNITKTHEELVEPEIVEESTETKENMITTKIIQNLAEVREKDIASAKVKSGEDNKYIKNAGILTTPISNAINANFDDADDIAIYYDYYDNSETDIYYDNYGAGDNS